MKQGAYAFQYTDFPSYLLLDSIGWKSITVPTCDYEEFSHHNKGEVTFQLTLRGEGRITLGNTMYQLTPGRGLVIQAPNYHYSYTAASVSPWEFIWLRAKGEDAIRMWERIQARRGRLFALNEASPVLDRFWELYRSVAEEQLSESAELSARLYRFILALLAPDVEPDGVEASGSEPASIVDKAKHFIQANTAQPLTLRDIADYCGVTGEYLCRLFRRHEAISPLEYVRRRRVESAATLLRETDLEVNEVGRQCGFESSSYFGKTFKNYLGRSPGAFRTAQRGHPFDTIVLNE